MELSRRHCLVPGLAHPLYVPKLEIQTAPAQTPPPPTLLRTSLSIFPWDDGVSGSHTPSMTCEAFERLDALGSSNHDILHFRP